MAGIRTLIPPGGFANEVGRAMAALDVGLDALKEVARRAPSGRLAEAPADGLRPVAGILRAAGEREGLWVHQVLGEVPTPPAPQEGASLDDLLGWLDAVRTVTLMVLRPLAERDLERLLDLPEVDGPTTARRMLSELLEHQAARRGELEVTVARLEA